MNFLHFRNFLVQTSFHLLFSRDRSTIQIQKIPTIPDSPLLRQISPLLQPSTSQGVHLSAFLENSTLRRVLNFFLTSRQVSLQML